MTKSPGAGSSRGLSLRTVSLITALQPLLSLLLTPLLFGIVSGCFFSLETYSCFLFFPSSLPPSFPPSLPSPSHLFLFHIPLLIDIFFFLVPCFLKGVFNPLKDLAKCECVSSAFYLTPRLNLFPQEETIRIKTLG